jgi:hypothetical protein
MNLAGRCEYHEAAESGSNPGRPVRLKFKDRHTRLTGSSFSLSGQAQTNSHERCGYSRISASRVWGWHEPEWSKGKVSGRCDEELEEQNRIAARKTG